MSSNNPHVTAGYSLRQLLLAVALVGLVIVNFQSLLMMFGSTSVTNSTYTQLESALLAIGLESRSFNEGAIIVPHTELDEFERLVFLLLNEGDEPYYEFDTERLIDIDRDGHFEYSTRVPHEHFFCEDNRVYIGNTKTGDRYEASEYWKYCELSDQPDVRWIIVKFLALAIFLLRFRILPTDGVLSLMIGVALVLLLVPAVFRSCCC